MVTKKVERSSLVFEVRIWSPKHYKRKYGNKRKFQFYNGQILTKVDGKTVRKHFHTASQFLTEMERLFYKKLK